MPFKAYLATAKANKCGEYSKRHCQTQRQTKYTLGSPNLSQPRHLEGIFMKISTLLKILYFGQKWGDQHQLICSSAQHQYQHQHQHHYQASVIIYHSFSHQSSVLSHQSSVISHQLSMFKEKAKHSANDASNDIHRPPLFAPAPQADK